VEFFDKIFLQIKLYMAPPVSWTNERILEGLKRFYEEHTRYPSAREFDTCPYLPTARQIQRKFPGGLPEFREKFLLEGPFDMTKGVIRSEMAKKGLERAYAYEEAFYKYLVERIPESLVHEQKRLRPGNVACDFYIYTSKNSGVALDLFYAMDSYTFAGIINIKLKRYIQLGLNQKIYFISVSNPNLTQESINKVIENRKVMVPTNIEILTEEIFKKDLVKFVPVYREI
jgi:hypothetical protein